MDYFYASTFANGYAPGLMDARIGGRFRASSKVDMELNYHYFSTAVKVQDLKKYLGSEVDYQINWSIMKDVKLSAGYSFMRGTKTMDAVKTGNHKSSQKRRNLTGRTCSRRNKRVCSGKKRSEKN